VSHPVRTERQSPSSFEVVLTLSGFLSIKFWHISLRVDASPTFFQPFSSTMSDASRPPSSSIIIFSTFLAVMPMYHIRKKVCQSCDRHLACPQPLFVLSDLPVIEPDWIRSSTDPSWSVDTGLTVKGMPLLANCPNSSCVVLWN